MSQKDQNAAYILQLFKMQTLSQLRASYHNFANLNTFEQAPIALYEPVNYIMNLGGKQIRPLLTLLATQMFKEDIAPALPAAFVAELFHNFSLVHDDIMDVAPLRRGKQTVHEKYDVNTGILSGDVMLIHCYNKLIKSYDGALAIQLVDIFNKVAIEVCEGQQYDINFETQDTVTISEYIDMIEKKTAALLGGALQMGAVIGGASSEDALLLDDFGRKIGIAFQLQDDILDTFGDPEKFGKKVGGDILQNKKTYLVARSFEKADMHTEQALKSLFNQTDILEADKIDKVRTIFEGLDIQNEATQLLNDYYRQAMVSLEKVNVASDRKILLKSISDELMQREK